MLSYSQCRAMPSLTKTHVSFNPFQLYPLHNHDLQTEPSCDSIAIVGAGAARFWKGSGQAQERVAGRHGSALQPLAAPVGRYRSQERCRSPAAAGGSCQAPALTASSLAVVFPVSGPYGNAAYSSRITRETKVKKNDL